MIQIDDHMRNNVVKNSQEVVETDLYYICSNLEEEFCSLANKSLLITGGAGFLGYYLVQSVLIGIKKQIQRRIFVLLSMIIIFVVSQVG
jgi:hypothetical protein